MIKVYRHYCGQLVQVEVFQSHDEVIAEFFHYDNQDDISKCPGCDEDLDIDFCGSPWLVEPMTDEAARYTATNKFCSNCWGSDFEIIPAKDIHGEFLGVRVVCKTCKEETLGYVSEQFVRNQKADDYIHWRTDIASISQALGVEPPVFRTEKQSLSELGF